MARSVIGEQNVVNKFQGAAPGTRSRTEKSAKGVDAYGGGRRKALTVAYIQSFEKNLALMDTVPYSTHLTTVVGKIAAPKPRGGLINQHLASTLPLNKEGFAGRASLASGASFNMIAPSLPNGATGNRLLDSIPREEFERLAPHLEHVALTQGQVLNEAGDLIRYVYFPKDGMVSLLSMTQAGETVEVAMVSSEGVVGVSVVLGADVSPYRTSVQLPAESVRVKTALFRKELRADGQLQILLLKFTHALMTQISQSAVCNRFHKVEKRLCRWLLVARDRVNSKNLNLTQEILSEMLGTSRTIVTAAANSLQDAGLIRYRRGKITLTDVRGLEASTCECYEIVKKEIEYLIAA